MIHASRNRQNQRGFSFVELIFVLVLMAAVLLFTAPQLLRYVYRYRLEGAVRETGALAYRARMEAMKRSVPVVVRADFDLDSVIAFADVNDAAGNPGSDLIFNPEAVPSGNAVDGGIDYEVGRVRLPNQVFFWGAADGDPEGADAVLLFSVLPDPPGTPNGAIFQSDGSVRQRGAFRFADQRGNFLDVFVSPEAAPRAAIRKYNPDPPPGPDGSQYLPPGWNGRPWDWY